MLIRRLAVLLVIGLAVPVQACVTHVMIGPVVAKTYLQFRAGRFVGGSFSFEAHRYAEVRAIFIEKYNGNLGEGGGSVTLTRATAGESDAHDRPV